MTSPRFSRSAIAAGAAALGALGAIGVAQLAGGSNPIVNFSTAAASGSTSTTTPGASANANSQPRPQKTPLDADTEAKVKEAALAAVPGATFNHAHKNPRGGYEALLTKSDGTTKVLVHEDANFTVTSVDDPAPARMGRGGHGPGDRQPLDADTDAKVKAAALEAVPGATYNHGHKTPDGYVAELTKSDGTTRVLVHEDANFKVTSVEDPAPARMGRGGHGPGDRQPLDADTAAKVEAAAKAAVPDATVEHTGKDRDGSGYVAMMEKADGTHVLVHEDANFKVTSVEDPAPMRGPGGPGGRGHGDRDGDAAPAAAPAA